MSIHRHASVSKSDSRSKPPSARSTSKSIFPLGRKKSAKSASKAWKHYKQVAPRPTRLNKAQCNSSGIFKPRRRARGRRAGQYCPELLNKNENFLSSLSAIVEALPTLETENAEKTSAMEAENGRRNPTANVMTQVNGAGVHLPRLNGTPGAMKRKVKVERAERERFGMNLAVLAGLGNGGIAKATNGLTGQEDVLDSAENGGQKEENVYSSERWKTLRNFIRLTS